MARGTGQERYVSDITLPRMLHGRIVSSPYAHARVLSVDTRAAEALEAVCLTFTDIPKLRYNERIVTVPWALHKDHTVLADKVRRTGEAVAAVAAETEALAERAVRAVRVEYEPLPVVTDPIEAMQPGAPALYDSVLLGDQELKIERNIACSRDILEGDPARAFAEAEVIVDGTFRTPKIYHAQMETKSVVCRPESDGGITVWPTTQSIHNVRILLGRAFHTSSAGAPQPGDVIDFSGALVKINQDGSVDVVTALMDHGGGTLEALARLVAETLCVPLDKVNISPGDTSITVYDVVTHATRGVYAGGGAVPDLGGARCRACARLWAKCWAYRWSASASTARTRLSLRWPARRRRRESFTCRAVRCCRRRAPCARPCGARRLSFRGTARGVGYGGWPGVRRRQSAGAPAAGRPGGGMRGRGAAARQPRPFQGAVQGAHRRGNRPG